MNWILSTLLALVAGSVGSVGLTPVSARLGEAAKLRHAAERRLHGLLCAYRQELEYQYDRSHTEQHGYPLEFASVESQEKLAEDVLRNLPDLRRRKAKNLREDLQKLVGPTMLAFSEGRMYVPESIRQNPTEQGRIELLLRRITREPERYCEGHLQRLLSEQNNHQNHRNNYQQTIVILDGMAKRVEP
jgi:hypothetical protein